MADTTRATEATQQAVQTAAEGILAAVASLISGGRLLVDASGISLTADVVQADMDAVTGVAPSSATLYDIHADLSSLPTALDEILATGLFYDGATMADPFLGRVEGGVVDVNNGIGAACWLADLVGGVGAGGVSPLLDSVGGLSVADLLCGAGEIQIGDGSNQAAVMALTGVSTPEIDGQDALVVASVPHVRIDDSNVEPILQSGAPHRAQHAKDMDGNSGSKLDWAQLTAPGQTASYQPTFVARRHVLQVTVANIDTNVVVALQGSVDGTHWYDMETAVTITVNGVSHIQSDAYAPYVRASFVSEAGGTAATVEFDWYGAR